MRKITERFENGLLVERITEETPDPVRPLAVGGYINGANVQGGYPGRSLSCAPNQINVTSDGVR